MFGRRICFLFATGSYLIGAVLCGAAQSMVMLIVARALCGLGIGAFDTLMKIVVAGKKKRRGISSQGSICILNVFTRLCSCKIYWYISILVGYIVGIGLCRGSSCW